MVRNKLTWFRLLVILFFTNLHPVWAQSLGLEEAKAGLSFRMGFQSNSLGMTFLQEISYARAWPVIRVRSLELTRLIISGGFNFWSKAKEGLLFRDVGAYARVHRVIYSFDEKRRLYAGAGFSLHLLRITPQKGNPQALDRVFVLKRGVDLLVGGDMVLSEQWHVQAEARLQLLRKLSGGGLYAGIVWLVPRKFSLREQWKRIKRWVRE